MSDTAATPLAAAPPGQPMPGTLRLFWGGFAENRGAVLGLAVTLALVAIAVLANLVAPHSPIEQFRENFLTPPVWEQGGTWRFLLGTDDVGRDVLSRLIHGARLSLLIGIAVVALSLSIGTLLGLIAAFAGGLADVAIMRLMDIVLVFPSLLLAIVIVAILGPGLFNAMIAVAIVTLPSYTRLTRAAALSELARDYVTATRCAGAGAMRLMFSTVLPNCLAPLIVQATLGFATAILDAAALGFLGLGAQPPTPEWGTMLAGALQFYQRAWWVLAFPGLAILLTVLAFNLFGDGLRDALDPKLRR
jgi:dipeptide transport system permease protein